MRSFYAEEPGQVLSTAIDKYIYVVVKRQIGIVEYKYRINWSRVEFRNTIEDIEHPIVREALKLFKIDFPIEITTFADVPSNTGLGSSSAFAVGLVNALYAMNNQRVTKYSLATEAAAIELDVLERTMGKQDHFASSYGGFNIYTFNADETVTVDPVHYDTSVVESLNAHLMLFYMGDQRDASEVLKAQEAVAADKEKTLTAMSALVEPMVEILSGRGNLADVGPMLHESWLLKRSITEKISNHRVDEAYRIAMDAGATGGKLAGAGGGGFLMLFVEPSRQDDVVRALSGRPFIKPGFDSSGSRITYYEPDRST